MHPSMHGLIVTDYRQFTKLAAAAHFFSCIMLLQHAYGDHDIYRL